MKRRLFLFLSVLSLLLLGGCQITSPVPSDSAGKPEKEEVAVGEEEMAVVEEAIPREKEMVTEEEAAATAAGEATTSQPSPVFFNSAGKNNYTDSDWNLNFYDNCGMPVPSGENRSVRWINEGDNKYIRFQLENEHIGLCSSDNRERHRAPYWERAELKQDQSLAKNLKYSLEFDVRFVEGFGGDRETFWQMHSYVTNCPASPPVMLKFSNGTLSLELLKEEGGHMKYGTDIKIKEIIGKWNAVKLVFDTAEEPEISVYFNKQLILNKGHYTIPECGEPHFKFGIYRPGNAEHPNKRSVVDFDKINLTDLPP